MVPSIFSWSTATDLTPAAAAAASPRPGPSHAPDSPPAPPAPASQDLQDDDTVLPEVGREEEVVSEFGKDDICKSHLLTETGTQVTVDTMDQGAQTREGGEIIHRFSIKDIKDKPEQIKYYTSFVSYAHFNYVLHCLGPAAYELDYKSQALDTEDEFFLFMIKLRQNTEDEDLSYRFGISKPVVGKLFHTWLMFLYFELKEKVVRWLPMDIISLYMPTDFKKKYPTTRVILDATEVRDVL